MSCKLGKILTLAIAAICLVSALLFPYLSSNSYLNQLAGKPAFNGLQTSFELSEEQLKNQFGDEVSLTEMANRPLFLTFGFTSCSFSCPVTLAFLKQIKINLGYQAQFALITVDPAYDTEQRLGEFLANFDSTFIGLRPEKHELDAIAGLLKVNYFRGQPEITHTDYIYLIHPNLDGVLVYTRPELEKILDDFKKLEEGA